MKLLIWIALILVAAVAISLLVGSENGYVLLVQPPYRIEISLNLFVVSLVVGFFFLHSTLRLIQYTLNLPDSVHRFKRNHRMKNAQKALEDGIHALVEGRYAQAEKSAARALKLGGDPGLSALVAARAAHKRNQPAKRDLYLAEAERLAPQAAIARLLTQAELYIDERQYTLAQEALQQLEKIEPHHASALKLQLKVYQRLRHWEKVLSVLALLERMSVTDPEHHRQSRFQAHQQLMQRRAGNAQELLAYWKKVARDDQLAPQMAQAAARLFIAAGDGDTAAQIIEMSLTRQWDGGLAALYGDCIVAKEPLRQLQQAEAWLNAHRTDAGLLLSLGHLCMRQELWGKAQSFLEASLSVHPNGHAHLALARLLERNGKQEAAYHHYRKSLEHAYALP